MRSMDAEAVLEHRVRNEQTSGEKKSPSKGVIIFKFFPARTQIFRQIGQTFGSRRERVKRQVKFSEMSKVLSKASRIRNFS
jgi:hypothetical protein